MKNLKGYHLGARLTYRKGAVRLYVTVFGRERNQDGEVEYYWVVDMGGIRFKAWPNELY